LKRKNPHCALQFNSAPALYS